MRLITIGIGPTGQVVLCALVGVGMLAGGSYFIGKTWRIFGQCLMGLGLGILYATFYSAFAVYAHPVMSQNSAFAFMVMVTVAGMALAIMHDAVSMGFPGGTGRHTDTGAGFDRAKFP